MARTAARRAAPRPTGQRMPTVQAVLSYWGPELERLGKADQEELADALTANPQVGICFACGWLRPLHRAHITARCNGGSDAPSNIHLLCRRCHATSEGLAGGSYWQWFNAQNQWSELVALGIAARPELALVLTGGATTC